MASPLTTKLLPLLLLLLLAACGRSRPELNLYTWSEYIDPTLIEAFEQRHGCKVNVDFFEDPDSMVAKLAGGGASIYDVVVPGDTTLPPLIRSGLLAPLRPEAIPNLAHIAPRFTNAPFDPGNRYGAPLAWGTTGIYARREAGRPLEDSWALIFDPARQPGPFLLLEDVRACIGAALRYQGHSLNSTDPGELAGARDLLIATKKRSLGFEGVAGCKNRVLARGAAMAMAYNGDAMRGVAEDAATAYILPREGGQLWMDVLSIPAGAPHRDLAEKFINFLLEPKIAAEFANRAKIATPNLAAQAFVPPDDLRNPAIYPPPDLMQRLEYAVDLGEKNKLYDELWTQIKSR